MAPPCFTEYRCAERSRSLLRRNLACRWLVASPTDGTDDATHRQPCAPQRSWLPSQAAPEREPSVLAGATPQAGKSLGGGYDATLRWRARSRTLSPEPPHVQMAAAAHVSWNASARLELPPFAGWLETAAAEDQEARRRDSACIQKQDPTPRPPLRARLRSPSPRYEDSPRSPAVCWRSSSSCWAVVAEQPPAPVKPTFYSRSPSPPPRSGSPPPCYGVRPPSPLRSTAAPNAHQPLEAQQQIAANPYHQMQHAAATRAMPMLRHGRVARYVAKHRYGFIVDASDPSGPDLFVNNASLALGSREIDTLRVGAYVTFRSDSRLVNGCVLMEDRSYVCS